jgi:hypothetical protein
MTFILFDHFFRQTKSSDRDESLVEEHLVFDAGLAALTHGLINALTRNTSDFRGDCW